MKLKDIKTDPTLESEGVPVEILPGIEVTVRSTNCPAFRDAQTKKLRRFSKAVQAGMTIPAKQQDQITAELMAEVLVAGWSGVTDDDDKPIPFSRENALKVLGDPENRAFRDMVMEAASTNETFRRIQVEEAKGN